MKNKMFIIFFLFILPGIANSPPKEEYDTRDIEIYLYEMMKEREFELYAYQLAYIESRCNYKAINSIDCIGLYQFLPSTLKRLGYENITPEAFRDNPDIFPPEKQLEALRAFNDANSIDLIPYINYIGKSINGIEITKAGLLAGIHLGGIGSVSLFLLSDGLIDKEDMNGTSISSYIKLFSIYKL